MTTVGQALSLLQRCTVAVVFRLLHILKILLYLYINIEIIFHSHTTLISNCNTATRNGFYLKCSAKTTFFQKSVVCVQHFYLYFHPIRYNYGKEYIRKNNALGRQLQDAELLSSLHSKRPLKSQKRFALLSKTGAQRPQNFRFHTRHQITIVTDGINKR